MKIDNLILAGLIYLAISSCKQTKVVDYYTDYWNDDRFLIEKNHITELTVNKISYRHSVNEPKWRRPDLYKFFLENGLCYLKVKPRYRLKSNNPSSKVKRLEDLYFEETIDYLGSNDSTFYYYDNKLRLLKIVEMIFDEENNFYFHMETNYTYDDKGSLLSECYSSENTAIKCLYSQYKYDISDKILIRQDSVDYPIGDSEMLREDIYIYDNKGNLINDGRYRYTLDSNGNILEQIPLKPGYIGKRIKYDNANKKVKEELIDRLTSGEVEISNQVFYKYDSRGLLIEEKKMVGSKIDYLLKYEYK